MPPPLPTPRNSWHPRGTSQIISPRTACPNHDQSTGLSQENSRQEEGKLLGFRGGRMQPAEGGRVFTRQRPTQPSTARKAKEGEMQRTGQGQRPGSVSQRRRLQDVIAADASRGRLWNVLPRQ